MLKVGITGGIGSGKSIVAKLFGMLGAPVYNADDAAKSLMNSDPIIKARVIETFGEHIYVNGLLNRPALAAKVFNNPEQVKRLNSIVHPVVINDAFAWMNSRSLFTPTFGLPLPPFRAARRGRTMSMNAVGRPMSSVR